MFGSADLPHQEYAGIASVLGYEAKVKKNLKKPKKKQEQSFTAAAQSQFIVDNQAQTPKQQSSSYYRVTGWQAAPQENRQKQRLSWYEDAKDDLLQVDQSQVPPYHQLPPAFPPLASWSRLLPFLLKTLGARLPGRKTDMPKLVKLFSSGVQVGRLPKQQRYQWQGDICLLIDINTHNFPYRTDFLALKDKLCYWRGEQGLDIQIIEQQPGTWVRRLGQPHSTRWQAPDSQTPLLILSDLGMHADSALLNWLAFGQRLQRLNRRATVLMPVAARQLDPRLTQYFDCVVWDQNSRLRPLQAAVLPEANEADNRQIQQLLALCYPALRVNMGLLRTLRFLLPHCDIGHENAIWRQTVLQTQDDEWGWLPEYKAKYVNDFIKEYQRLSDSKQQTLRQQLARSHARIADVLYFEVLHELNRLGISYSDELDKTTQDYIARLVKTYANKSKSVIGLNAWGSRFVVRQAEVKLLTEQQQALLFLEARRTGRSDFSPDIPQQLIRGLVPESTSQTLVLRQQGQQLQISTDNFTAENGVEILRMPFELSMVICKYPDDDQQWQSLVQDVMKQSIVLNLPLSSEPHLLEINQHKISLEVLAADQLPEWMAGYSMEGTYTTMLTRSKTGQLFKWYWHPPSLISKPADVNMSVTEPLATVQTSPGFWYECPTLNAENVPEDWPYPLFKDQYGLYAEVDLAGIRQRFRWIQPGYFQMGSPPTETGRFDNEILHPVTLSRGYWLAETACTQALWQAVMEENPSRFKEANRPVENVSWHDVQRFLDKLNRLQPQLNLRLPTEAEWEYACRAKTQTPFNFAEPLSTTLINYRGVWEYGTGEWGEGALQETAAVKSYPPNAWGLYEMHGNVWEWCQDWYGEYPPGLAKDPPGPASGSLRVLRGGSWSNDGRDCRSAVRYYRSPVIADDFIGFRLARGQEHSQSGADRQPDGTHAAAARGAQPGDGLRSKAKPVKDKTASSKKIKRFT
jgi:formylglycine-generating enzyme required for sulfatase activity